MSRRKHYSEDDAPYVIVEKSGGGSFGAFLLGALIGGTAALLLAPRSGRETREGIANGVRRVRDTVEDTVQRAQDAVTGTIDGVRQQVTDRLDAARSAVDAGRQAARESRAEMERRIREARAGYEAGRRSYRENSAFDAEAELGEDEHA